MLHDLRSKPRNAGESCYDVPNKESKNKLTNVGQNLLALGLLVLLADLGLVRGAILGVAGSLLLLVFQPLLHQAVPLVTPEDHNCHCSCCHWAAKSKFLCYRFSPHFRVKNHMVVLCWISLTFKKTFAEAVQGVTVYSHDCKEKTAVTGLQRVI